MLMDIKCSMVPSIAVNLRFDDQSEKHAVVSVGDLDAVKKSRVKLSKLMLAVKILDHGT